MSGSLLTAAELRSRVFARYEGLSYAQIGRELGLSDEFVRQISNGAREPSRAFLNAVGFERVMLYRERMGSLR